MLAVTNKPIIPIKVTPYDHQQKAFLFVCRIFGVLNEFDSVSQAYGFDKKKEGDANDSIQ